MARGKGKEACNFLMKAAEEGKPIQKLGNRNVRAQDVEAACQGLDVPDWMFDI